MQVNLNCNCPKPNPNFGMAMHSDKNVNKLIQSRITNSKLHNEFRDLVKKADINSKFDIRLFANGKRLEAKVFSANSTGIDDYFCKTCSEQPLEQTLFGPLHFIKRVVLLADKKAAEQKGMVDCSDVFKLMSE